MAWLRWGLCGAMVLALACGPKVGDDGGGNADGSSGSESGPIDPTVITTTGTSTTGSDPNPTAPATTAMPPPPPTTTEPVTTFPPTATSTTGDPMPGEFCSSDDECVSGHCYIVGILGGICGECTTDADCPNGGCSPPNPLADPPEGSFCNQGELGAGCESDDVCEDTLSCEVIIDVPGVITASSCSECANDGDCPNALCSTDVDVIDLGGVRVCVPPQSKPNGASCDLDGTGNGECASTYCATADVMGLLQVGVCSECLDNADCGGGTCFAPDVDLNAGLIPGFCG